MTSTTPTRTLILARKIRSNAISVFPYNGIDHFISQTYRAIGRKFRLFADRCRFIVCLTLSCDILVLYPIDKKPLSCSCKKRLSCTFPVGLVSLEEVDITHGNPRRRTLSAFGRYPNRCPVAARLSISALISAAVVPGTLSTSAPLARMISSTSSDTATGASGLPMMVT